MFQKSGAASTLSSEKYLPQPFARGPVCAKKFARLEGVKEGEIIS